MRTAFMLIISIVLVPGVVSAKGFLGQRYIGAYYGVMTPGEDELEEIDDDIIGYGIQGQFPLSENLDLMMSIGFEKLEGSTTIFIPSGTFIYYMPVNIEAEATKFGSDIIFHFLPDQTMDPFITAGFIYYDMEMTMNYNGISENEDDTETGIGIGAGVELSLNEHAAIAPTLSFISLEGESDFYLNIQGVIWMQDLVGFTLGLGYAFEEGDTTIQGGIGVKF